MTQRYSIGSMLKLVFNDKDNTIRELENDMRSDSLTVLPGLSLDYLPRPIFRELVNRFEPYIFSIWYDADLIPSPVFLSLHFEDRWDERSNLVIRYHYEKSELDCIPIKLIEDSLYSDLQLILRDGARSVETSYHYKSAGDLLGLFLSYGTERELWEVLNWSDKYDLGNGDTKLIPIGSEIMNSVRNRMISGTYKRGFDDFVNRIKGRYKMLDGYDVIMRRVNSDRELMVLWRVIL